MRLFRFVIPVICALSLSACSGTFEGMGADAANLKHAVNGTPDASKPVVVEAPKPFPEGYWGQNRHGIVLKPPGAMQANAAPAPEGALVWHQVDDYNPDNFGATESSAAPLPAAPRGRAYNDDVQVFPVGGGDADAYNTPESYSQNYGGFEQQLFFAHASSKVKPGDKKKLHGLAKRLKARGPNVAITVVGHASHRVDRVKDALKKKMINFAMAQKRANAVSSELKRAGVKPAWVQAVSKGDDEPNPDPGPMGQEAADRRAEVYVEER